MMSHVKDFICMTPTNYNCYMLLELPIKIVGWSLLLTPDKELMKVKFLLSNVIFSDEAIFHVCRIVQLFTVKNYYCCG